jgi:protein OPY2
MQNTNEIAEVERTLRTIFKRCVECPNQSPECPDCPDGKVCSLIPYDCNQCAHMVCIDDPSPPIVSKGPNVGAIAGSVVGGVAFVILIVICIYFFWIKKKRAEQDAELEEEWADDISSQKRSTQFTGIGDAASTRTRGSLAASILSRASNIIQIAYIPGVTNRNGSATNSIHGPVPPVPAAHRMQPPKSPLSNEGDALFFRPDSTWSGTSSISSEKRDTRYTMASISPSLMRDSVASDTFMDNAASTPMPATAATRLAPRMVSVKSSTSSNSLSGNSSNSVQSPDDSKPKGLQVLMPGQGSGLSPSTSVRSAGKAKQVQVGGIKGRFPVRQTSDASTATGTSKHAPTVSSPLAERQSPAEDTEASSPPSAQPTESPFFDASEHPPGGSRLNPYASMASTVGASTDSRMKPSRKSVGGLSAVDEESLRRASRTSALLESEPEERVRRSDESPFSDDHATD